MDSLSTPKLQAEWLHDCQGKQDYDAPLVELSTRYYPRGGGFTILTRGGVVEENAQRTHIKPGAHASILLQESETLCTAGFQGETEADVKAQVEAWAQAKFSQIVLVLRTMIK